MGYFFCKYKYNRLTVGLGDTLQLVLLLDGVAVAGATGGVDQLISQALGDGLDVTEGGLPGAGAQQPDGLVHTSQRGHVDGLSPDGTLSTDTGGVLTGARVDDGVNKDLQGVLAGGQVDDLETVLNNANSHELLAVVAAVHHEAVDETLDNGALGLLETLGSESGGRVGEESGELLLDRDVVLQGHVLHVHILTAPSVTKI